MEKPNLTVNHPSDRMHQARQRGYGLQQSYRLKMRLVGGEQKFVQMDTYVPTKARGEQREQMKEEAATWLFLRTQQFLSDLEEHEGMAVFSYDIGDKMDE